MRANAIASTRAGRRLRLALLAGLLLALAHTTGAEAGEPAFVASGGVGEAPEIAVALYDNYFEPGLIEARHGDVLVFENRGEQLHSLTLVGHEALLDEAYLDPGQSLSFTLPEDLAPGEYELGCNIHFDMSATIVVSGALAEQQPPDGNIHFEMRATIVVAPGT